MGPSPKNDRDRGGTDGRGPGDAIGAADGIGVADGNGAADGSGAGGSGPTDGNGAAGSDGTGVGTFNASTGSVNGKSSLTARSGAARSPVSDAKKTAETVRQAEPAAAIKRRAWGRTSVASAARGRSVAPPFRWR